MLLVQSASITWTMIDQSLRICSVQQVLLCRRIRDKKADDAHHKVNCLCVQSVFRSEVYRHYRGINGSIKISSTKPMGVITTAKPAVSKAVTRGSIKLSRRNKVRNELGDCPSVYSGRKQQSSQVSSFILHPSLPINHSTSHVRWSTGEVLSR